MIIKVKCGNCGDIFSREKGEVSRSKRLRRKSFCDLVCAAEYSNAKRELPIIKKLCEWCGDEFSGKSTTKFLKRRFCGTSCATLGCRSDYTRMKQRAAGFKNRGNLTVEASLKSRESWKYGDIEKFLDDKGVAYEFEFRLGKYIYDLALTDLKMLIEFDGLYHKDKSQKFIDRQKNKLAHINDYKIFRIKVGKEQEIFQPNLIKRVLSH